MARSRPSAAHFSPLEQLAFRQALDELCRPSYRSHDRRLRRLVASYRSQRRRGGGLPRGRFPLEDLRLDVLTYRWGIGLLGEPRPRIPLVTYRPFLDDSSAPRVVFARVRVVDAASRRQMERNFDDARLALALHQAGEDARPEDWSDALPLPRFLPAGDRTEFTAPETMDRHGWESWPETLFARPCPAWTSDDGAASPDQPGNLTRIAGSQFADLTHLRGRHLRCPMQAVLAARRLLARDRYRDLGVTGQETYRQALEDYATSEPGREAAIRRELAAACVVQGVTLPDGPEGDAATAMMLSPWQRIERTAMGRILLVRLSGPPGASTARFVSPHATLDLADLGPAESSLDDCSRRVARSVTRGRRS